MQQCTGTPFFICCTLCIYNNPTFNLTVSLSYLQLRHIFLMLPLRVIELIHTQYLNTAKVRTISFAEANVFSMR